MEQGFRKLIDLALWYIAWVSLAFSLGTMACRLVPRHL